MTERDGAGHAVYEFVDGMKGFSEPLEIDLLPVTESVFAGTGVGTAFREGYMPVVFPPCGTARAASTSVCAADPRSLDYGCTAQGPDSFSRSGRLESETRRNNAAARRMDRCRAAS